MEVNKLKNPKMIKVKASEFSEIFQTKKEFMMVLKEGGKLSLFISFIMLLLDFYIPPKRDINFMFMKKILNKKKKVRCNNFFL